MLHLTVIRENPQDARKPDAPKGGNEEEGCGQTHKLLNILREMGTGLALSLPHPKSQNHRNGTGAGTIVTPKPQEQHWISPRVSSKVCDSSSVFSCKKQSQLALQLAQPHLVYEQRVVNWEVGAGVQSQE